jgi:hypothetical protein
LLKAPAGSLFWNLPEFGRRIRFDDLHGCEMRPLEAHFQSREELNVTRSEIRRVRWLGDDRNAFLGEELLSSPNHRSLRISLRVTFWLFSALKIGLKVTRFATMEDIECDGRTAEDSKRSLPPVLPTMAGSMQQECVCAQGSYFEGD